MPTWTEANGQDDIVWHQASVSGNTASFYVPVSAHKGESTQNYTLENTQKSAHESAEKNTDNSCYGLIAEVVEKTFAGGQLRVVLKTSEGQEIVASRYGIDTNVSVGEKVRCCFLPTDAVLVDQGGTNA